MAFDEIDDKFEALNQLISMNVDRVLTKGCKTCALDGKNTLKNLVEKSDNRITILVGGGVTYKNYKEPWNTVGDGSNSRLKISSDGLLFYAVNIMDDGSYKNTISMDQVKRIRTITDNCPHRWAWKSDWAFTGK